MDQSGCAYKPCKVVAQAWLSGQVSSESVPYREREPPLADLNTVLKETTTETHEAVQELKGDLAGVKKQLGNQQKMITAMYRHKVKHEMPT